MIPYSSILLFDGECNLCNNYVKFILSYEKSNLIKFSSLQSKLAYKIKSDFNLEEDYLNGILFFHNNILYKKSTALFIVSDFLIFPINFLYYFKYLPICITDFFYDIFAKNRYNLFGKSDSCWVKSDEYISRFIE